MITWNHIKLLCLNCIKFNLLWTIWYVILMTKSESEFNCAPLQSIAYILDQMSFALWAIGTRTFQIRGTSFSYQALHRNFICSEVSISIYHKMGSISPYKFSDMRIVLSLLLGLTHGLYEDQIGRFDWRKELIGLPKLVAYEQDGYLFHIFQNLGPRSTFRAMLMVRRVGGFSNQCLLRLSREKTCCETSRD